ncbi:Alanyl-tRNA editing protein AlaX-L [Trichoplax sp. H2]|uniref:Threonyl/alanyl tRNA synthetase SAD domain-containing protein n=1 Tax=Trichoplax adhaerens TaxID=10228 RepID=B3RS86_TRIAD|nr:hypothetical protein TRIADDRAFT_54509 [Trichoplax adhaerens]EDV27011.1 hypothetical protein TRIADDRAFT_54509 [Trichoplax adhaerens]RDD46409.1 Alanyl-tRNA editing protein AlaX-L [Trichoplax sp. H2]|eukprot:XP_002111007.1 hypothetical protein TRIADDRAFT_54509 [Trichoplax adhaerens]
METKHLFWDDTYSFNCNGTITDIRSKKDGDEEEYIIVVDNTVMHPQGGGQPADVGLIKNQGEDVVFHVHHVQKPSKEALFIEHVGKYSQSSIRRFDVGDPVIMQIDEAKRRLHARLHSAGHLLDGALQNLGITELVGSKGYHFPDNPYVEYIGNIPVEKREEIVKLLNEETTKLIAKNLPVEVSHQEGLRYVNIAGVKCPCGGTHVKSLKEIGKVTATKMKKSKKNTKISYFIE